MPYQPSANSVYISRALTTMAVAQAQELTNFVALQAFPKVGHPQKEGKFFTFPQADWNRSFARKRKDNEEAAGGGFTVSTDTFSCDLWSISSDIGQQANANQDPAIQLRRRKVRWCIQQMYLALETDFNTTFMASEATWGAAGVGYETGVAGVPGANEFKQWSDPAGVPLKDIQRARTVVIKKSGGFDPNTLVMGYAVFAALKTNPEILDRIKYTNDEAVTAAIMARYFEVERILVMKAVLDSSQDFIGGKVALLCYVNPTPGISDVDFSAGYTITWEGLEASIESIQAAEVPVPLKRSTRIEVQSAWDMKLVSALGGFYFKTAVA